MADIEEQKESDVLMCSETRLKKISAKLKWTITDFPSICSRDNKKRFPVLKSSTFFLQDNAREKSFKISFQYDYQYLQVKCSPELPKYATVVMSILNQNGKASWKSQMFIPPLYRIQLTMGFLLQYKQTHLPNNTLRMSFRIEIIEDLVTEYVTDLNPTPAFSIIQQFLENQTICDVTFLIGDQQLKAHKVILAARSPVFLAMFSHEFSEQKDNEVTILDIRPEVFKALLRYVYDAEVTNIKEIADELLIAADKYLLEDLKMKCEGILIADMLQEKAVKLLNIAIQYKCVNLEVCCRLCLSEKNDTRKDCLRNDSRIET